MTAELDTSTAMMLGEVRGQLRELVHQGNNQMQKNDAVARALAKLESIPDDITEIKKRITALENDGHRREGATSLMGVILKSPALGWLVSAAVTAWALLTGKVGG